MSDQGYGHGYGYGHGDGYGNGHGHGYGNGHGYGFGHGHGYGNGHGHGHGYGQGHGFGDGYGFGNEHGYGSGSGFGSGNSAIAFGDIMELLKVGTYSFTYNRTFDVLAVGCHKHPAAYWVRNGREIAEEFGVTESEVAEMLRSIGR